MFIATQQKLERDIMQLEKQLMQQQGRLKKEISAKEQEWLALQ